MTIYIFLFIFLLIMLIISKDKSANQVIHNIVFYVCIGVLTVFACLRAPSVGKDTSSYINLFFEYGAVPWKNILSYSLYSGYETGYILYNKILYALFPYPQTITAANSVLFALFMYGFLKKFSKDSIFSLYIFYAFGYYQTSFNIVSSLIAAMIIYYNMDAFYSNKLKAAFIVILAFLFHRASIVLIILAFIEKIPLTKRRIAAIVILAILGAMFYNNLLPVLSFLAPTEYQDYLERNTGDNGLILIFHVLIIIFLRVYRSVIKKKNLLIEGKEFLPNTINWLILLEICIFIVALRAQKFTRLAYMFTPAYFIYIPEAVSQVRSANNRLLLRFSLIVLLGLQYFLRLSINNIGYTVPYLIR